MKLYSLTKEELEDHLDMAKVETLQQLIKDNLITPDAAEKWSESHSIMLFKKSLFRTLSDKFKNAEDAGNAYYLVAVQRRVGVERKEDASN